MRKLKSVVATAIMSLFFATVPHEVKATGEGGPVLQPNTGPSEQRPQPDPVRADRPQQD